MRMSHDSAALFINLLLLVLLVSLFFLHYSPSLHAGIKQLDSLSFVFFTSSFAHLFLLILPIPPMFMHFTFNASMLRGFNSNN